TFYVQIECLCFHTALVVCRHSRPGSSLCKLSGVMPTPDPAAQGVPTYSLPKGPSLGSTSGAVWGSLASGHDPVEEHGSIRTPEIHYEPERRGKRWREISTARYVGVHRHWAIPADDRILRDRRGPSAEPSTDDLPAWWHSGTGGVRVWIGTC